MKKVFPDWSAYIGRLEKKKKRKRKKLDERKLLREELGESAGPEKK